jgi:hypothetical protein
MSLSNKNDQLPSYGEFGAADDNLLLDGANYESEERKRRKFSGTLVKCIKFSAIRYQ